MSFKERAPNSAGGLQSSTRSLPIVDSPESAATSPASIRKVGNPYYSNHNDKALQQVHIHHSKSQEDSKYWANKLNASTEAPDTTAHTARLARSERNSVTSLYFGEASLEKAHSMSMAERMSEKTGTAVTSEAAAKYLAGTDGTQGVIYADSAN